MLKQKSPSESSVITHHLVKPNEINPNGVLFAGVLMSWIDHAAFLSAGKHAGHSHVVTVNLDQIHFKFPLRVGDHIVLSSTVDYVGRTSMEVGVKVEKEDHLTDARTFAASASLTLVSLGEHSRPTEVPRLFLSSPEEFERYRQSRNRVRIRGRLHNWFQERFPRTFQLKAV